MNANRLSVMLAYHRGLRMALAAEATRGNFDEDVRWLQQAGLIYERTPQTFEITPKGQDHVRKALTP